MRHQGRGEQEQQEGESKVQRTSEAPKSSSTQDSYPRVLPSNSRRADRQSPQSHAPEQRTCVPDSRRRAAFVSRHIPLHDLDPRAYRHRPACRYYSMDRAERSNIGPQGELLKRGSSNPRHTTPPIQTSLSSATTCRRVFSIIHFSFQCSSSSGITSSFNSIFSSISTSDSHLYISPSVTVFLFILIAYHEATVSRILYISYTIHKMSSGLNACR